MSTIQIKKVGSYDDLNESFPINTIENANWVEFPYKPEVTFQIGYDDRYLYVRFEVVESHVRGSYLNDNEPVWQDSCVEIFIQEPDTDYYYNFEVNCIGTILAARRTSRADSTPLSEADLERVIRGSSLPPKRIDRSDDPDAWALLLGIPFDLIGCKGVPAELRANLYKCGDRTNTPHYLSWSPIDTPSPDFHRPEFFGTLML
ncbi:MAG: carbohydrate-binding family 9-like protein [Rikenellaceae bacterium]